MKKLFEALQGGSLTLVLVLLGSHLVAEGERCNTVGRSIKYLNWRMNAQRVMQVFIWNICGETVPPCGQNSSEHVDRLWMFNLLAMESGSLPCCIVLNVLLTASIRVVGVYNCCRKKENKRKH